MSIDRTNYNALVDDDGSNLIGTPWTKNIVKTVLLDPMDARWSESTTTATGPQDNLAYSEADVLRCNNATTITLRGLLAPAAPLKPGKPLLVVAIGAGTVVLNDQDTNSTAANRIITGTAAPITLAAGVGFAWLRYDSATARWRVVGSSVGAAAPVVQTTTLTGTQNDVALTTGAVLLRANNATALTLTGLAAGSDGQRLVIVAIGAGTVALTNQDAGSTAANRIITGTAGTLTLAAGTGVAVLAYDATTARWRVTGSSVAPAAGAPVVQSTSLTGAINNFALTTGASSLFVTGSGGTRTFSGFAAGVDGQVLVVVNSSSDSVVFLSSSGLSTSGNQIATLSNGTMTLSPNGGSAQLVYHGSLWIMEDWAPLVPADATKVWDGAGNYSRLPLAPRVTSVASSATPAPNADTDDLYDLTALAAAAAFTNPSGTPVNGQKLIIRIKDNATARALTWGTAYVAGGVALPSTTVLSKITTIGLIYNTANALNKWMCVAVSQEA